MRMMTSIGIQTSALRRVLREARCWIPNSLATSLLKKAISWEDAADFLKELKRLHARFRHPNVCDGCDEGDGLMKHEEVEVNTLVGDWRIIAKIARGFFGFVYKATNINSSVKATLKKAMKLEKAEGLLKEADIMKRLDHKNIVKLINVQEYQQCNQVVLIMEYMTGDPLSHRLAFQKNFSPNLALGIMKQMASAFAYMHSKNIVHRDIKLGNMLCNDQLEVKIIDLGLAFVSTQSKQLYDLRGTQGYMAPEIFFHNSYTGPPADVWSLGILFTQLLIGLEFDGLQIIKMSDDCTAYKVVYNPPPSASESLASLLTAMLHEKPVERLTRGGGLIPFSNCSI
uniref:Protein kinase domain-containing protein n=1 Tax=Eptatretus burgeri TaxID=7764 RepID=A0A8C4QKD1_EPTBU